MDADQLQSRKLDIYDKRMSALTYTAIGKEYSIPPEHIRQIFKRYEYRVKADILPIVESITEELTISA